MKNKLVFLFLMMATSGWAQEKSIHFLQSFDKVKVFKGLVVNLIPFHEQKIVITGEKASEVYLKNKNGNLTITLNLKSVFDSKSLQIDLYYTGLLLELEVFQGATIRSKHTLEQAQLQLSAREDARIELDLALEYLKIKALTGGSMQLTGTTKSQNCKLSTGATYQAFNLKSEYTNIVVSSGAVASIYTDAVLDAKATFGGEVNYKGTPSSLLSKKLMGGQITQQQDLQNQNHKQ
jgi:hypothetical protein